MNINQFCRKAIGVPFLQHGRDWNAWDCWGLMCVAYEELFNIQLPTFDNDLDIVKDRDKVAKMYWKGAKDNWKKVEEPEMGDVVLIYMYGRACHVGLVIDKKRMLHVEHGINTCIQNINTYRIEGIYRYVGK